MNARSSSSIAPPPSTPTNSFSFASSAAVAAVAVPVVVADAVDDFPQLQQRATGSKPATRTGLNYKASLLTAIDSRMHDEQERLRKVQRKEVEDKRELYEKMKYDDDRAASARAAFEPDYSANSASDAIADDEEFRVRQRRA